MFSLHFMCLIKVQSAQPAIDFSRPADHMHVLVKLKKIQKERERMHEIERENQRLLQRLSQIMLENRLDNYWKEPHPNFLNRVYIKSSSSSASSSSKRRAQSVPPQPKKSIITNNEMTAMESYNQSNLRTLSKSRSCMRCPTCSGKAITTTNVVILGNKFQFHTLWHHLYDPNTFFSCYAGNLRGTRTICTATQIMESKTHQ